MYISPEHWDIDKLRSLSGVLKLNRKTGLDFYFIWNSSNGLESFKYNAKTSLLVHTSRSFCSPLAGGTVTILLNSAFATIMYTKLDGIIADIENENQKKRKLK